MSLSMYRASIPVFIRGLEVCASLLQKGAAFADEKGLAHADVIGARLAPDMLPLAAQVQRASDTAKLSAQRLSGVEAPRFEDDEDSFAALQERIAKTVAYLKSIDKAALADSETRTVTLKFPDFSPSFSGVDYLLGFGLPNFYFHVVTTHDILRHLGAPIGKRDYLGALN
ncbi:MULTISPECIES: DUF1993 domain-containing protein [unclassified Caballeronia]|uniref:DUF1993 domain-containing protein n=1 Tax=unclassified Caballeronia TaxID=2646786 RepID=UPI0028661FE8|nr:MULTISPECIES: DUF1993 domain-containing protein [unclassified Caballeronia]MDR5739567.1 DUF1993 domain-containing protein [Caballeronia sp. LZ016]MDR5808034.1 DUF1993 domain-containing protein [Caballeronia sp. LZ019]